MKAAIVGWVEILLRAYFGTVHSLAGESAQCTHNDWRNEPDNRYNRAARKGVWSTDAL
tara:strand:+ start:120 stop:293 length:174 start_codon:yes stop_codon:yes gene_type:complete